MDGRLRRVGSLVALLGALLGGWVVAAPAAAVSFTAFGAGSAGSRFGLPISFGDGGDVFQLESRLVVGADVFDPAGAGLPANVGFAFAPTLSDGDSDLVLSYAFTNTSAAELTGLSFLSYVDAEIDEPKNTFFNEFATSEGAPAPGQSFEADEPGFVFGNLLANLDAGELDGTNAVPAAAPEDVAMALSFAVASLLPGERAVFEIMLSEDGDRLGFFALVQDDADPLSTTTLTYSGQARIEPFTGAPPIPEPSAALAFGLGVGIAVCAIRRR